MDFTINLGQPSRAAVFATRPGRIKELRFLTRGASTHLDGQLRPAFLVEHCSDAVDQDGQKLGVIRVISSDPRGFEVLGGQTTVVTADWQPDRDFIVDRHSDTHPAPNSNATNGAKIGWSKLYIRPDLFASYSVVAASTEVLLAGEFFVGFKPGTTDAQMAQVNAKYNAFPKLLVPDVPAQWIKTNAAAKFEDVFAYYAGDSHVDFVVPVFRPQLMLTPNDPDFSTQYEKAKVHAEAAWDKVTGSRTIRVAVIDSGLDLGHAELINNIAINQAEIPASVRGLIQDADGDPAVISFEDLNAPANNNPAICKRDNSAPTDKCDPGDLVDGRGTVGYGWQDGKDDDGNGLVDDIVGWNFAPCGLNNNQTDVMPGCGNNLPDDNYGHGTAVGGLIGGETNNGLALAGTAWRVGLVPYRVFDPLGGTGGTNVHAWVAIRAAAKESIPIINYSGGGTGYKPGTSVPSDCKPPQVVKLSTNSPSAFADQEKKVWNAAQASSALIVNAVADCTIDYDNYDIPNTLFADPAWLKLNDPSWDNILAVTSSDSTDTIKQARGGKLVDMVAPGEGLTVVRVRSASTEFGGDASDCSYMRTNGSTAFLPCSGTSFAAPQVAAAAALLLTEDSTLVGHPTLIKARLKATAHDVFSGKGGAGLLDMKALLNP